MSLSGLAAVFALTLCGSIASLVLAEALRHPDNVAPRTDLERTDTDRPMCRARRSYFLR